MCRRRQCGRGVVAQNGNRIDGKRSGAGVRRCRSSHEHEHESSGRARSRCRARTGISRSLLERCKDRGLARRGSRKCRGFGFEMAEQGRGGAALEGGKLIKRRQSSDGDTTIDKRGRKSGREMPGALAGSNFEVVAGAGVSPLFACAFLDVSLFQLFRAVPFFFAFQGSLREWPLRLEADPLTQTRPSSNLKTASLEAFFQILCRL